MFIKFKKIEIEEFIDNKGTERINVPRESINAKISALAGEEVDNIHLSGQNIFKRGDCWKIFDHIQSFEFQRIKVTVKLDEIDAALITHLFEYHVYFYEFDFPINEDTSPLLWLKKIRMLQGLKRGISIIKKTKIQARLSNTAYIQMNLLIRNSNWKRLNKNIMFGLNQLIDVILVTIDQEVNYQSVLPAIEKSIETMILKKPLLFIRNIPFCMMRNNEYFIWDLYQRKEDSSRIFLPECSLCCYKTVCIGVPVDADSRYGSGFFIPVEQGKIIDLV